MDLYKLCFVLSIILAFILVFAFDCIDAFLKRHIAQKHPGQTASQEQDPGAAEGS